MLFQWQNILIKYWKSCLSIYLRLSRSFLDWDTNEYEALCLFFLGVLKQVVTGVPEKMLIEWQQRPCKYRQRMTSEGKAQIWIVKDGPWRIVTWELGRVCFRVQQRRHKKRELIFNRYKTSPIQWKKERIKNRRIEKNRSARRWLQEEQGARCPALCHPLTPAVTALCPANTYPQQVLSPLLWRGNAALLKLSIKCYFLFMG